LVKENKKLQNELTKLKENELKYIVLIDNYEKSIQSLNERLEKLLTL